MRFILTKKAEEKILKDMAEMVLQKSCKNSGIHSWVAAYNKTRNDYQPQYAYGGISAEIHNMYEREMMFNETVAFIYCKYCGEKKPIS